MSRTFKDRGYRRKKVNNAFLQKICMSYSDDFKGKNSGRAYKNGMIRQRIKRLDDKEMREDLIK